MYDDRAHAGRSLAGLAEKLQASDPIVAAIPRGGVIVGREIALRLGCDLDVVMAGKIGAPFNPEYAVAAVEPDGQVFTLPGSERAALCSYIAQQAPARVRELNQRLQMLRRGKPEALLSGRTVFLVDDGLATGLTAMAAARYVRRQNPKKIILTVPVAPPDSLAAMKSLVDAIICPLVPTAFRAVGEWYRDFRQVKDEEVIAALADT